MTFFLATGRHSKHGGVDWLVLAGKVPNNLGRLNGLISDRVKIWTNFLSQDHNQPMHRVPASGLIVILKLCG